MAATRRFVETVLSFYAKRAAIACGVSASAAKSGAFTVVQRTSSDLRLNPHLHVVFLDGAYHEQGPQLAWQALGHLQNWYGRCGEEVVFLQSIARGALLSSQMISLDDTSAD